MVARIVLRVERILLLHRETALYYLGRISSWQVGKNIKLAGEDLAVGITLTNEEESFKISEEDIVVNHPSKLILLIPKDMPEGGYELTITTQYGSGGRLLKAPRSVSQYIRIENQKS